jgi:hypothetical protein
MCDGVIVADVQRSGVKSCISVPIHVAVMVRMMDHPADQGAAVTILEDSVLIYRVREASSASYRDCVSALLDFASVEGVAPSCDDSRVCAVNEEQGSVTEKFLVCGRYPIC